LENPKGLEEQQMNIDKKLDNGCLTLKVEGRLDTNTSPELEEQLKLDGVTAIRFDFSGLEYISSAGLRVFLTAQKKLMPSGGKVVLRSPNSMVRSVLDITGCADIFQLDEA
jgi:anti-sigma B factor antagonist